MAVIDMAVSTEAGKVSPFQSILEWSKSWPEWQRDSLRRIVITGTLSDTDRSELLAICRARHGLFPESGVAPSADPLAAAHIPGGAGGTASVSLIKLSNVQNVGRLAPGQELPFGPAPGLTVIYGENASGKSGYARIIKKACRARGSLQPVKPDVFAATGKGPSRATIEFADGETPVPFEWRDGLQPDPRLGNIFVFDSFSARSHVVEDGPACFKPRGLEILPKLAGACDAIKAELKEEIDAKLTEIGAIAGGWKCSPISKISMLLTSIGPNTKPETVEDAAVFTDADERRLIELTSLLSADPRTKAADTAAAASRLRAFAADANARAASVSDAAMREIEEAIRHAETTARAAAVAAAPKLEEGDLPGSCGDVWRELWKAARKFSEIEAYPGSTFPVTGERAKCVLCQQSLQKDAVDRFSRFDRFVNDESRSQAEAAEAIVAQFEKQIESLRPVRADAAGIRADLDREQPGQFATVEAFAEAIDSRIAHALKCLTERSWAGAPVLPESPCEKLELLAANLDERAREESAAADPGKWSALALERDELTDRKWLAAHKDEVKAQITRHVHLAKLRRCQDDCDTGEITRKSGALHDVHVTTTLCKAFADELTALGMRTIPVRLDGSKGKKGERLIRVKLSGASTATVDDIASEGEHRCIALAAFLAELSQTTNESALVFDDPVSSLDHKRREEIAKRLVREAEIRQVIVFTHDLAFVCDLEDATSGGRKSIHCQHIECKAGRPGNVARGLIWDAMSADQQLKNLRERIGRADKISREGSDSEYNKEVGPIIDDMRAACERIIEDVLLGDLLKRHSSQIKVGNLEKVVRVTTEDWLSIKRVWSACSDATYAHANAKSGPHKVPDPAKLKEWLLIVESTVESVKRARSSRSDQVNTAPEAARAPLIRAES